MFTSSARTSRSTKKDGLRISKVRVGASGHLVLVGYFVIAPMRSCVYLRDAEPSARTPREPGMQQVLHTVQVPGLAYYSGARSGALQCPPPTFARASRDIQFSGGAGGCFA